MEKKFCVMSRNLFEIRIQKKKKIKNNLTLKCQYVQWLLAVVLFLKCNNKDKLKLQYDNYFLPLTSPFFFS